MGSCPGGGKGVVGCDVTALLAVQRELDHTNGVQY